MTSPTEIGSFMEDAVEQAGIEDSYPLPRNKGKGADLLPSRHSRLVVAVNNFYVGSYMSPKQYIVRVIDQLRASDPHHEGVWVHVIPSLVTRSRRVRQLLRAYNVHLVETREQLVADAQHDLTAFTRVVQTIKSKLRRLYNLAIVRPTMPDIVSEAELTEVELPYFGIILYCSPAIYDMLAPYTS